MIDSSEISGCLLVCTEMASPAQVAHIMVASKFMAGRGRRAQDTRIFFIDMSSNDLTSLC